MLWRITCERLTDALSYEEAAKRQQTAEGEPGVSVARSISLREHRLSLGNWEQHGPQTHGD
jgi:hypothetical protein